MSSNKSSAYYVLGAVYGGLGLIPYTVATVFDTNRRVVPLATAVTGLGVLVAVIVEQLSSADVSDIVNAMTTVSAIMYFFMQDSISQEFCSLRDSHRQYYEWIAECKAHMRSLPTECYETIMAELNELIAVGYDGQWPSAAFAQMCRQQTSDRLGDITVLLLKIAARRKMATPAIHTRALCGIIIMAFCGPLPIALYNAMGFVYIPLAFVVFVFLMGAYELAIEASNPFNPRFPTTIECTRYVINL
jgi:hypothetical protein